MKIFKISALIILFYLLMCCQLQKPPDAPISWTQGFVPGTAGKNFWKSITMSANCEVLAAAPAEGFICISNDRGDTWKECTNAGEYWWTSLACSADGQKLAAASDDGDYLNSSYLFASIDGGNTWKRLDNAGKRNWVSITSSADGSVLHAVEKCLS